MKKTALMISLIGWLVACDDGRKETVTLEDIRLKRFSSCEEMDRARIWISNNQDGPTIFMATDSPSASTEMSGDSLGETNIQVQGVDELDTSKASGDFIYYLEPKSNSLTVLRRNPHDKAGIVQSPIKLDGIYDTKGLFVTPNKVIVLGHRSEKSEVNTKLFYFNRNGNGTVALQAERVVDGALLSARLIEDRIHLIQSKRVDVRYDIEESSSSIDESLPRTEFESKQEILASCSDIFHEPAIADNSFIHPVLSSLQCVMTIKVNQPKEKPEGVCIAANNASTLYASKENLFLASHGWSRKTPIHQFSLANGKEKTKYVGSTLVSGALLNQFSMDEFEGHLRIATTGTDRVSCEGEEVCTTDVLPSSRVFAFQLTKGDPKLVGESEHLAQGERIFAVRFMGKQGYVVTFRQVDPLFVLDLSDPKNLRVRGELKITGFSRYLHPLSQGYLLGVGRAADETGRVRGLALSIFDVQNPDEPKLAHSIEIGNWNTRSEVEKDHHAFRYIPEKDLVILPVRNRAGTLKDLKDSFQIYQAGALKGFTLVGEVILQVPIYPNTLSLLDPSFFYPYPHSRSFYRDNLISFIGGGEFILRSVDDPNVDLFRISIR